MVQTTQLPKDARIAANAATTESFIASLPGTPAREKEGPILWRHVPAETVADYVRNMEYPPGSRATGDELSRFIRTQATQGELIHWTVVLISNSQAAAAQQRTFAGQSVGLVVRSPASQTAADYALRKANILSPRDESLDLSAITLDPSLAAQLIVKPALAPDKDFLLNEATRTPPRDLRSVALALTRDRAENDLESVGQKSESDIPNGHIVRELRPKTHGLLLIYPLQQPDEVPKVEKAGVLISPAEKTGLDPAGVPIIGLALSFPDSETATRVEYQVNKKWNTALQEDPSDDD